MAFNKIARKSSDFRVVFTVPDFCWPPPPSAPATQCSNCSSEQEKSKSNKNYLLVGGLSIVAAVAIISPFDGPLGDAAALGALGTALAQ